MEVWISIWTSVGACAALASLPGTLELAVLTFMGMFRVHVRPIDPARRRKRATAIVVPAHDEEGGIAGCIESLQACESDGDPFSILVVADNCSDHTAERAA